MVSFTEDLNIPSDMKICDRGKPRHAGVWDEEKMGDISKEEIVRLIEM